MLFWYFGHNGSSFLEVTCDIYVVISDVIVNGLFCSTVGLFPVVCNGNSWKKGFSIVCPNLTSHEQFISETVFSLKLT